MVNFLSQGLELLEQGSEDGTQVSPGARCPSPPGTGHPRPRADTPGPQPQPMDLRVGQRPPVEPPPEPALLALQHPQRLHHHLFFAGLPQRSAESMRLPMDAPVPQSQAGPQEQELRQLLHKDKSKRSKDGASRPGPVARPQGRIGLGREPRLPLLAGWALPVNVVSSTRFSPDIAWPPRPPPALVEFEAEDPE
ncbi:histone deacetylase 7-like [Leptonychotes weddellii]|uniref:Histone deacetylase 7-like n=1 Tax=Leptonychotes weddellii TaxID=9713 RepID=A0A7F8QE60_LEPWE|nr:histone deacetylase 7-like [Leptonychotes weddellii]